MNRPEIVEFYINRPVEKSIVEKFKDIFEAGLTSDTFKGEIVDLNKSMKEELHNQIDELFKGE